MNLYNDIDPFCCDWLEELIRKGEIPPGIVRRCSIEDLTAEYCSQFTQCHFFAGVGGWPLALRISGVAPETRLWTASLPCQPFSKMGNQLRHEDSRHLYPTFEALVAECQPPTIFGEQVACASGVEWIDGVSVGMEAHGYAIGKTILNGPCVKAPQRRNRLYWVADSLSNGFQEGNGPGQPITDRSLRGGVLRLHWDEFHEVTRISGQQARCEPGTLPLAYGVSPYVGHLRGYGNAIIPQLGSLFIDAFYNL